MADIELYDGATSGTYKFTALTTLGADYIAERGLVGDVDFARTQLAILRRGGVDIDLRLRSIYRHG
mgnify:CR=1 FL=1